MNQRSLTSAYYVKVAKPVLSGPDIEPVSVAQLYT